MELLQIRKLLNSHNVDNNIINDRIIAYNPVLDTKTNTWTTSRDDLTDYTKQELLAYLGY